MEAPTGSEHGVRLLGLGNELLGDDAFGILAAREAGRRFGEAIEVVCSSAAGFGLLDDLLGATQLLVVDTIMTGAAPPGTIYVVPEHQVQLVPGGAPHQLGLFEVLAVGRKLGLPMPGEVLILGVEPWDCSTVGAAMHPDVRAAISVVVDMVGWFLAGRCLTERYQDSRGPTP